MNTEFSLDYRYTVKSPDDEHQGRLLSDMMENSHNPMSFECVQGNAPYSVRFQVHASGNIGLSECQLVSPIGSNTLFTSERTRSHMAHNSSSEFIVAIWLGGKALLNAGAHTHTGQAGDFTITNSDTPLSAQVLDRGHCCNLSLPASWDRIGDTRLENVFGCIYSGHEQHHNTVADYARHLLSRPNALASPDSSEKLYDVVALALNPRAKSEHQTGLLALIHNHIDIYYMLPELDTSKTAAAFDISVRHLHRLFSACDTSFTEYLIERRLAQALLILADPRYRQQTILNTAFDCGFRDINHFGRRFRSRFGITPGEYRRIACVT